MTGNAGEVAEDVDDLDVRADMLQMLVKDASASEQPQQGVGGVVAPVSWTELERSCQRLDEADIRITSLDLSCATDDTEGISPASGGPGLNSKSVLYNFEVDSSPTSSHDGDTPSRTYSSASLSNLASPGTGTPSRPGKASPPRHLSRSASTESFSGQGKAEPACLVELRKHLAKKGLKDAQLQASVQDQEITGAAYSVLATPAKTAVTTSVPWPALPPLGSGTASPVVPPLQLLQVTSALQGCGDIVPVKPLQSFASGKPSIASGGGRSGSGTSSGKWGTPGKLTSSDTRDTKRSSSLQASGTKVNDPRLAHELFQTRMKSPAGQAKGSSIEAQVKKEYSSLVLPGARARPEARPRGVQGLFHSVRNKCGDLFYSSHRAGKAGTTH